MCHKAFQLVKFVALADRIKVHAVFWTKNSLRVRPLGEVACCSYGCLWFVPDRSRLSINRKSHLIEDLRRKAEKHVKSVIDVSSWSSLPTLFCSGAIKKCITFKCEVLNIFSAWCYWKFSLHRVGQLNAVFRCWTFSLNSLTCPWPSFAQTAGSCRWCFFFANLTLLQKLCC